MLNILLSSWFINFTPSLVRNLIEKLHEFLIYQIFQSRVQYSLREMKVSLIKNSLNFQQ